MSESIHFMINIHIKIIVLSKQRIKAGLIEVH